MKHTTWSVCPDEKIFNWNIHLMQRLKVNREVNQILAEQIDLTQEEEELKDVDYFLDWWLRPQQSAECKNGSSLRRDKSYSQPCAEAKPYKASCVRVWYMTSGSVPLTNLDTGPIFYQLSETLDPAYRHTVFLFFISLNSWTSGGEPVKNIFYSK